nr:hypothetical protein [Tanacetum cinerariifolium]
LDPNEDITLVNDQEMFDVDKDLQGEEVVVEHEVVVDKELIVDVSQGLELVSIRCIQGIGYGVLGLGDYMHGYAVSSLMDMAYWFSEHYQLKANQTPIRMDKSDAWRTVAHDIELSAAKEAVKAMRNLQAIIQCKSKICFRMLTKDNRCSDEKEDVRIQNTEARRILIELEALTQRLGRNNI